MIQPSENTEKKELIIQAAERLFGAEDFDAVSVRDIAREAGANVAMISYYFGSKEKLYEEVIRRRMDLNQSILKEIVTRKVSNWERVQIIIDHYVDTKFNNREFQKIMNREMSTDTRPHLRNLIVDRIRMNREMMMGLLEDGIRKKEFRKDVDIEMLLLNFFASMSQITGSTYFSCQMFNKKSPQELFTPDFSQRIKKHFTTLFKNYLLLKQ